VGAKIIKHTDVKALCSTKSTESTLTTSPDVLNLRVGELVAGLEGDIQTMMRSMAMAVCDKVKQQLHVASMGGLLHILHGGPKVEAARESYQIICDGVVYNLYEFLSHVTRLHLLSMVEATCGIIERHPKYQWFNRLGGGEIWIKDGSHISCKEQTKMEVIEYAVILERIFLEAYEAGCISIAEFASSKISKVVGLPWLLSQQCMTRFYKGKRSAYHERLHSNTQVGADRVACLRWLLERRWLEPSEHNKRAILIAV
jgi:hypothetical protein